jgi:Sulfotransferase family
MIGRHSEVGILNEDKGWAMRSILGKHVVGNKRCVPNQIELRRRRMFHFRFLKTLGIANEYPSSKFSIEDYLSLPNIKIIGLIRGGNEVISSIVKRSEKSLRAASYRWCRAIEIIYELKQGYPELVLVVAFEDLVLNPRPNMERVAAFLNLEYQDRMLQGPQYNPWYGESTLNKEKVDRAKREKIDYNLGERFPATYLKYSELLRLSTT